VCKAPCMVPEMKYLSHSDLMPSTVAAILTFNQLSLKK
jgi:hypothetical protein